MKTSAVLLLLVGIAGVLATSSPTPVEDNTLVWTIESPGGYYILNGDQNDQNPTVNLTAGVTLTLVVHTASNHPVCVLIEPVRGGTKYPAATPVTCSNSVNFTVPIPATNYPPTLYFLCAFHGFYATVNLQPPSTPPELPKVELAQSIAIN